MLQLRCATFRLPLRPITPAPARLAPRERDRLASRQHQMSASQLTRNEKGRETNEADKPGDLAIPDDAAGFRRHVEHQLRRRTRSSQQSLYKLPGPISAGARSTRQVRKALSLSAIPAKTRLLHWSTTNGPRAIISAARISIPTIATSSCSQGTWWVSSGPKFDLANATPMPAGRFVTHCAKQVHWDGAKDEDTVLLIMGEGPATSTAAEQK